MQPAWSKLAKREGLLEADAGRIAQAGFGDFIFRVETDAIFDVTKARQAGFAGMTRRSDEVMLAHLEDMRAKADPLKRPQRRRSRPSPGVVETLSAAP
jgi:hypothetical protein